MFQSRDCSSFKVPIPTHIQVFGGKMLPSDKTINYGQLREFRVLISLPSFTLICNFILKPFFLLSFPSTLRKTISDSIVLSPLFFPIPSEKQWSHWNWRGQGSRSSAEGSRVSGGDATSLPWERGPPTWLCNAGEFCPWQTGHVACHHIMTLTENSYCEDAAFVFKRIA